MAHPPLQIAVRPAVALPLPLVTLRHPLRWLLNKLHLLLAASIFAYLGMLMVAAVYYLVFEVDPTMTHIWHTVVWSDYWRHLFRNVGEGLLGGLLAHQIIWNHYKKSNFKPITRLDQWEIDHGIANPKDSKHLSARQFFATPPLVLVAAVPGFCFALAIAALVRHFGGMQHAVSALSPLAQSHLSPHTATLWDKFAANWTQNWDQKLVGYGAALFWGRRPAKGVFDDIQLALVQRRVRLNKPFTKWQQLVYVPAHKARFNEVRTSGIPVGTPRYVWLTRLVHIGMVVGFGLAVYGWYILTYIAT